MHRSHDTRPIGTPDLAPQLTTRATDCGVIALVPHAWAGAWSTRHHVLSRLARRFPVVWLEPSIDWRKALRMLWHPPEQRPSMAVPPGMQVHRAGTLTPKFYRPAALCRALYAWRLRAAVRALRRQGCHRVVLYVWRPEFAEARELVDHTLCVYHIDDEYSFADGVPEENPVEVALAKAADLVFIHSPGLLETKGRLNANTTFAPNGVDFAMYASPAAEPADLRAVPRPRVGYTGFLKQTLDWDLLYRIATERPDLSLVLVGPANPHHPEVGVALERLRPLPNVFLLGAKRADELAAYPQHFDVSIMPYAARSHMARFGYPLKLHEYLASGSPVVGARSIRTLRDFADVIQLADDEPDWLAAIDRALGPEERSAEARARRQSVARRHDWDLIVARIADAIDARLAQHPSR